MTDDLRSVQEGLSRAIRRLNVLEYVILLGIVVLALAGGGLLALLLEAAAGLPFRLTWVVGSILLFLLPGLVVLGRESTSGGPSGSHERASIREEDDG